jgi:hypothetical protein
MSPAVRAYYISALTDMLYSGYVGQYEVIGAATLLGWRAPYEPLLCCPDPHPYTSLDNLLLLVLAAEGELE